MATNYDKMTEVFARASADFIKTFLSLTIDDQIIDVGGGTAQTSFMLKKDFGLTKPIVCVDPSKEMLEVAERNGAIIIQSTAEDFFATKPRFPLNVVIMNGCIHHFEKPDYVISQLASYMPEDGVCVVTMYTLPLSAGNNMRSTERLRDIYKLMDFGAVGLKGRIVENIKACEMEKEIWYLSIRNRISSFLSTYSDEELEDVIMALEKELKNQTVFSFETCVTALVITNKNE